MAKRAGPRRALPTGVRNKSRAQKLLKQADAAHAKAVRLYEALAVQEGNRFKPGKKRVRGKRLADHAVRCKRLADRLIREAYRHPR